MARRGNAVGALSHFSGVIDVLAAKNDECLATGRSAAAVMRFMQDAHAAHGLEATRTIGNQSGRCRQGVRGKGLDRLPGEWPLSQAHADRLAGVSWRHGSRLTITCMILCLSTQAVGYDTPRWRLSSAHSN